MKRVLFSLMLLAGLLGMTCSCTLLNGDDDQASGSIFGTWKPDKLTLRQPDVSIDIPGLFSSHQTAIYAFHRTTETIKK